MTTATNGNSTNGHISADQARDYILSLKAGKPDFNIRAESFGDWEDTIQTIERFGFKSGNDSRKMTEMVEALCGKSKALQELMASVVEIEEEPLCPPLPKSLQYPPEMAAGACPWLEKYVEFSKKASPEGFDDFHVFIGLWVLSTINGRRSVLKQGTKRTYGNIMIALCAITSMAAKSLTASVGQDVIEAAGLSYRMSAQKSTPQKFLSNLAGRYVPKNYDKLNDQEKEIVRRKIATAGQRSRYFDEFGKFIQNMQKKDSVENEWASVLLTFFDCPTTYTAETIGRGEDTIDHPYVSVLGAMTYPNLSGNSKQGSEFWQDGFWARFCFVAAPPDYFCDCPIDFKELIIPPELLIALHEWDEKLGMTECEIIKDEDEPWIIKRGELPQERCTISPEAENAYKQYRSAVKHILKDFKQQDLHGNYDRLPEQALRIALLIASLGNNGQIEMRHWVFAQILAEVLRVNLHRIYIHLNGTPTASASLEDILLQELYKHHQKGNTEVSIATLKAYSRALKPHASGYLETVLAGLEKAGDVFKGGRKYCLTETGRTRV